MRVLHVGPPLTRTGGPAGYLLELRRAWESSPSPCHELAFPAQAPPRSSPPRASWLRGRLRRWKRKLIGAPRYYRPSREEIEREGGSMADLLSRAAHDAAEQSRAVLAQAAGAPPDVIFVHDVLMAREAIARRGDAEIWIMVHSPMPIALYLAWSWGCPEMAWEEIAALPDVRREIEEEIEIWKCADRIVLPCSEALEELVRVDARFADVKVPIEFLLTGSSAVRAAAAPAGREEAGEPVGLFLGSAQPYRGLDVLVAAVERLPDRRRLPGVVAIAGPDPDSLPNHPRLRKLGRVDDVSSLLASVDFLVNTNRFCLFDLSNIEAVAAAKPLLLHAVGGNKALAGLGAGSVLFEPLTPDTLAEALARLFSMAPETLAALGKKSRDCYERHLTAEAMWLRHRQLYDHAESRVSA